MVLAAVLGVLGCAEQREFDVQGLAIASRPIRGATVVAWRIDFTTGAKHFDAYKTTRTDEAGRFHFRVTSREMPLLVQVLGGTTEEYWPWSPESTEFGEFGDHPLGAGSIALDHGVHLEAVLNLFFLEPPLDSERPLVVSPYTTVVAAIARRQYALGLHDDHSQAVHHARSLVGRHVLDDPLGDVSLVVPEPEPIAARSPAALYALALTALGDVARTVAECSGQSTQLFNSVELTGALVVDGEADALLDGNGGHGSGGQIDLPGLVSCPAPGTVSLDCASACRLTSDTLRVHMARALLTGFMRSDANTHQLRYEDVGPFVDHIATNDDPRLFGPPGDQTLDSEPPRITALPTMVYDEQHDRISFDYSGAPVHHHQVGVDTRDMFGDDRAGKECPKSAPTIHKHIHRLRSADQNPLRWRIAVADDVVGFDTGVQAYIGASHEVESMTPVPAVLVDSSDGGPNYENTYEITALADHVPQLEHGDGSFFIAVEVSDWKNNRTTLRGCWHHVLRAPPIRVEALEPATAHDSFADVSLESNNLAFLLDGEDPVDVVLLEARVGNRTAFPVYLELDTMHIEGSYGALWVDHHAEFMRGKDPIPCIGDPVDPCTVVMPDPIDTAVVSAADLVATPLRWRVVSAVTRAPPIPCCEPPLPGAVLVPPNGDYLLQFVTSDLSLLVPPGLEPFRVDEIHVGPVIQPSHLTGAVDGTYFYCYSPLGTSFCDGYARYHMYRALVTADLTIESLLVQGYSSSTPDGPWRSPRPPLDSASDATLAQPIESSFLWTTQDVLPSP